MNNIDSLIIHEILDNKVNDKTYYMKYHPDFFSKYPVLSKRIFEPGFDKNFLIYMLEQNSKIENEQVSEHDASVDVGSKLVNTYIKPLFN